MKADRIHNFGPPSVIVIDEMPRPTPQEGDLVARVRPAGVGPWDALIREGHNGAAESRSIRIDSRSGRKCWRLLAERDTGCVELGEISKHNRRCCMRAPSVQIAPEIFRAKISLIRSSNCLVLPPLVLSQSPEMGLIGF